MKKITALIMMALLITIGGVYAAWTYAGDAVSSHTGRGLNFEFDEATVEGASGTLTFSESLKAKIDDDENDDEVHKAVFDIEDGNFVVVFAPAAHAEESVEKAGIPLQITALQSTDESDYDGKKIITSTGTFKSPVLSLSEVEALEAAGQDIKKSASAADEIGTIERKTDGKFYWTLSKADVLKLIVFYEGEDLYLNSKADHDTFRACVLKMASVVVNGETLTTSAVNFVVEEAAA